MKTEELRGTADVSVLRAHSESLRIHQNAIRAFHDALEAYHEEHGSLGLSEL
jgi:hypothetical protein